MNFSNCCMNSTASDASISPFDSSVNEQEFNSGINSIFESIEVENESSNGDLFLTNTDNKDFQSTNTNNTLNFNDFYEQQPQLQQQQQLLEHQFQYVLVAPTSPAIRINEDSLTYLNQGQNYELRILRNDSFKSLSNYNSFSSTKQSVNSATKMESSCSNSSTQENKSSSSLSVANSGPVYLSIIRLCFWDRKLQEIEQDEIKEWEKEYRNSRMLEIENNLTFGTLDIRVSNMYSNAIEVIWDGNIGSTIYFKCNCTSTAFAKNKHGGEKGVHMRLQIDTFEILNSGLSILECGQSLAHIETRKNNDTIENSKIWWKYSGSSYCRIQLFRLKGAQRKFKTDKLKIDRLNPPDLKKRYQLSQPITELYNCSFDSLYSLVPFDKNDVSIVKQNQLPTDNQQENESTSTQVQFYIENNFFDNESKYATNGLTSVIEENYSHDDLPMVTSTSESESENKPNSPIMFPQKVLIQKNSYIQKQQQQSIQKPMKRTSSSPMILFPSKVQLPETKENIPLMENASHEYLQQWLVDNRFNNLLPVFYNYNSNDFLRLSKEDLMKLCSPADAIRCYNLAHNIHLSPKITIYLTFENIDYFTAVYLNESNCSYLIDKVDILRKSFLMDNDNNDSLQYTFNYDLFLKTKGILIKFTDEMVSNLNDQTKYLVKFEQHSLDTNTRIIMMPLDNN